MQTSVLDWTYKVISGRPDDFTPPMDMRVAISRIKSLPPLPQNAHNILQLANDPLADAQKLAKIIERDPLLTAQVIRWASSSLYGYRGRITTVQEAISRVLGFDFVLNLALGLAAVDPLKTPKPGPIGIKMFLQHAFASTRLMPLLNNQLPVDQKLPSQQVFLAAMLHNIGFALLGHEFLTEFKFLEKLIQANPTLNIFKIETFAFGINHSFLGAWLMKAWAMPKAVVDVIYHHHNPNYNGAHATLSQLTLINDCLLAQIGIGDAMNQPCPEAVFSRLSISGSKSQDLLDTIATELNDINQTVDQLLSI